MSVSQTSARGATNSAELNIPDFLNATRHSAAFREVREQFTNFDLANVDGATDVQIFIWEMRVHFDGADVQTGKPLDEIIVAKLAGQTERLPSAARAWLLDDKAALSPRKSVEVARAFVKSANRIPAPSMHTERGAAEYEGGQLVSIIRPHWTCAALSTHAAHAARMIEHIGDDLRFCPSLGWLTFDARQWQRDDRHATQTADRAKVLSQNVRDEAATLYELAGVLVRDGRALDAEAMGKAALQHMKHAKQVETKNFLDGSLHFAAGSPLVRVSPDAFDQRPWLLGFQNGVWDAGVWREHRREDYLLNLCPVVFDADADREEWERVMRAITGGDDDFARTLQDVAGYILSGASHLRLIPWLYGPKGTGKSTFAELLQTVLGRMAATIDPKKLQDDSARERLGADLWNRRLAVCAEAGSQKLEAELLKTLSGADTLTVRFLYQEAFDALPRHVLLMVSNDAPKLDAYDDALKDRVVALPFVHRLDAGGPLELTGGARIEAVRKDPNSPLVRGFTAWALEGLARVHQTQSIFRAACLKEATAKFWADTDPLTPFWETVDEDDLHAGISNGDLRTLYEKWCEIEGARPNIRGKAWAKACESHGLKPFRTSTKRGWRMTENDTMTANELFPAYTREVLDIPHIKAENGTKAVIPSFSVTEKNPVRL
jgi:P4 family phage/plasmid primase-like protien